MAEIIVTSTADSGAGSLRQAITDASSGDVILFDSDVFPAGQTTSILLSSYITVNKSVSIYGGESDGQGGYTSGATKRFYVYREIEGVKTKVYIFDDNSTTEGETLLFENVCRVALDGQGTGRCAMTTARSDAAIVISGLCLQNGYVNGPAACFYAINDAPVVLMDCAIKDSIATSNGSGIFFNNTNGNTLSGCSIVNCNAATGAGYYASNAAVNIINDCCFDSCSSTSYGGAILASNNAQQVFNNCTIYGCSASSGGGVYSTSTSQNALNSCVFDSCSATNGGAAYCGGTSQNTLNDCTISGCSASSGGGFYSSSTSQNTLNDCTISGCSAYDGGGIHSTNTSQNMLNDCTITGCSATNDGGGVLSGIESQNTLNRCIITNCSATNGGAAYSKSSSTNTLINCTLSSNTSTTLGRYGFVIGQTSVLTATSCNIDAVYMGANSTLNIDGINLINAITTNTASITIADGAALTITDRATIGAATFTSAGRGYLAVASGINTSAATLTNVVLCAYGADVSSFAEVDGVLEWDADDPSVSVLLEREDNDAWTTLAQTTGESLDYYLPPKVNLRLFDGERFLTTATPDSRTYFYIGGAEGSFDDAEDWSLTKDGTAIPQSPTITDCAFVIQGAEGDVAISKGSANVTNATIIPAGTNDIAVVVDEATVLAGTERFTGTLTTTGDVAIDGDASKLAIVVDGTLEVAGSLKLATLTLTSGSSVVFASADDVLVVTDSATVNDATFSCEEPTAYFTAPVGTDLTQATFTNVYVATKGAEVVSVTGSRFGKNYSINIISEDNTLPVTVEYRLEGTTEWIVADPAFVGTTFQIRLDDEATFRVYNGEKFTEATMKVYGLYNEMAAIVEIGYLI